MPTPSLPRSLADLLIAFGPCFTQPTMRTFQALVAGFLAWPGQRTVTGMLAGAGLAGRRHHDLGYRFFSTARWSADQLGLVLLDLITAMLVPAGAPVVLAGRRHPLAPQRPKAARRGLAPRRQRPRPPPPRLGPPLGRGRRHRPSAVPAPGGVPARPGAAVAPRRPRPYPAAAGPRAAGPGLRPPRRPAGAPGRRRRLHRQTAPRAARPRHRDRAATQRRRPAPAPATPNRPPRPPPRQRRPAPGADHARRHDPLPMDPPHRALLRQAGAPGGPGDRLPACQWYGALKGQPVQVVLSRPVGSPDGYQLALVTTDLAATPAQVIERYADRWPVEMVFPQLAKARVRALGCGGQRVADLDLAVGHDHPVDEQLHQQPPLGERGRGQPVPDGPAETLDPVGDSAKLQPLLRDRVQLVLLVGQGGPAALQLPSLALELAQGDDLGQVGVQQ